MDVSAFFGHLQGSTQQKNTVITGPLFFFVITVFFSVEYPPPKKAETCMFPHLCILLYLTIVRVLQCTWRSLNFFKLFYFVIRDEGPAYAETCSLSFPSCSDPLSHRQVSLNTGCIELGACIYVGLLTSLVPGREQQMSVAS